MDEREKELGKKISIRELESEELDQELSIAQKKAAISEAKKLYGKDWKRTIWGAVKSLRVDKETMQTLHGMGIGGGQELRDMNNPSRLRK